ncbi:hypothetical protein LCGC14_0431390 [marine sediment metagenome]|uniref:HicB-like antitoxin of toxin-antitoxin system domain-containing protein n=1 Tax=marine sediment metagenome TaxID=412755 RepID=A0A0F9SUA3_9ZZZZ
MKIESILSWMVVPDETTEGNPCFVVYDLDLHGCMGQGLTEEEATADWLEARKEYLNEEGNGRRT